MVEINFLKGKMNGNQNDAIPSTSTSMPSMENAKEQPISSSASAQKVSYMCNVYQFMFEVL